MTTKKAPSKMGRPKLPPGTKRSIIAFRLKPETKHQIRNLAHMHKRSHARIVELAIQFACDSEGFLKK